MKILFKEDSLHNLNFIFSREWFEGNIHGCFANQSILGINTKRYHGLFNLNLPEFEEPTSILATLEEKLHIDDFTFTFSSFQFGEQIEPKGYLFLKEFQYFSHPQYNYEIKGIYFSKELLIHSKYNALILRYKFEEIPKRKKLRLIIKPFFTFKKLLSFKTKDPSMSGEVYNRDDILEYRPYSTDFCLYMAGTESEFINSPLWYYNFYHALDTPKPSSEDYFNPGFFEIQINHPGDYYLVFSTKSINSKAAEELFLEEKNYRYEKLEARNDKDIVQKSINLILHKYFYFFNEKLFIKNSPMENHIDILNSLWSLPGLIFYDKFLFISKSLKNSWDFLKVKNFLPDKFVYGYNSRVFETPLANMFYIIMSRILYDFSKEGFKQFIKKSLLKELFEAFLKDRFSGIRMHSSGRLIYTMDGESFSWKNPFGLNNVPVSIEVDEYLINLLWYNVIKAFQKLEKTSFGFWRRLDLNNLADSVKNYLYENSPVKLPEYSLLEKSFILALPELPVYENLIQDLREELEANLTPNGLKITIHSPSRIVFYLPVGIFLYLFYLKKHAPLKEFKEKSGYYLTFFMDNLHKDTLMHFTESFIETGSELRSYGSNLDFVNLSLAYFWYMNRLLLT